MSFNENNLKIGVFGLGYVGLPIAFSFGRKIPTIGFDISDKRIKELQTGIDINREYSSEEIDSVKNLKFSSNVQDLKSCTFFIVCVPTPVDQYNMPDLSNLKSAASSVGEILKPGDTVVFESTVYPGCTDEICVPILETVSGLKINKDFYCGYSPERINPGDTIHTLEKIKKITSGSSPEAAEFIDDVYSFIIDAGTVKVSSIKVAESAKVIENAQRDINIAFINELAIIFKKLGIDTEEVLKAAATKWNFIPFKPGLVGGHCIGVDPYYLTYKAQNCGYNPEVILAGRRINDNMGRYIARQFVKLMVKRGHSISDANILILGITFKENCSDIRNSKVFDVIEELEDYGCRIDVSDCHANPAIVFDEAGIVLIPHKKIGIEKKYHGIIIAVAHKEYRKFNFSKIKRKNAVLYDVKWLLDSDSSDERL